MTYFVLMGDNNFSHTLEVSVQQIKKIYPEASILFYDWGVAPEFKSKLEDSGVSVIDWVDEVSSIRGKHKVRFKKIKAKLVSVWNRKTSFGKNKIVSSIENSLARQKERLLFEKIACMRHASKIVKDSYFVFLDADAILVSSIDELFKNDVDLSVTIRKEEEIETDLSHYQVVNSGVIVFGKKSETRNLLLDSWFDLAQSLLFDTYLAEQTGLGLLIERNFEDFNGWKIQTGLLKIDGTNVHVEILPCEIYNYNWIEEILEKGGVIEKQKVLHFKGSRHEKSTFTSFFNKLKI